MKNDQKVGFLLEEMGGGGAVDIKFLLFAVVAFAAFAAVFIISVRMGTDTHREKPLTQQIDMRKER